MIKERSKKSRKARVIPWVWATINQIMSFLGCGGVGGGRGSNGFMGSVEDPWADVRLEIMNERYFSITYTNERTIIFFFCRSLKRTNKKKKKMERNYYSTYKKNYDLRESVLIDTRPLT